MEDERALGPLQGLYHALIQAVRTRLDEIPNVEESLQIESGRRQGATHVLDVVDEFDYSHYSIPVMPGQSVEEVVAEVERRPMQCVHTIFRLTDL